MKNAKKTIAEPDDQAAADPNRDQPQQVDTFDVAPTTAHQTRPGMQAKIANNDLT